MEFHGKALSVFSVAVVFLVLTWITLALRFWVRVHILKAVGRDDWCMVITQMWFTIYLACQIGGVVYGTGQHLSDLEPWRAEKALSFWWACEFIYVLSTTCMKLSIGLFLLRVAVNRYHIWVIHLTMALSGVFGFAFTFVLLFQCWPVSAFWTLDPTDGHCINANVLEGLVYGISGLNVIADWIFALLPAFVVKDLQMQRRRKISVICVMGFACVGSTATIVRLPDVWSMKQSSLGWNGDFLWDTTGIAIWSTVEVGIGCTAGCLATLWPLVQMIMAKFGITTTQHNSGMRTPTFGGRPGERNHDGFELDGRKPGQGVKTTIVSSKGKRDSQWPSENSSEEHLARPGDITRQIVVEYDEESSETGGSWKEDRPAARGYQRHVR